MTRVLPDPSSTAAAPIGRKFDSGKPRLGLLPPHAVLAIARVLTIGSRKYEDHNWLHVAGAETRYMDAMLRHVFAHMSGEQTDPETGENHLAHAGCCLMFLLDSAESGHKFPTVQNHQSQNLV